MAISPFHCVKGYSVSRRPTRCWPTATPCLWAIWRPPAKSWRNTPNCWLTYAKIWTVHLRKYPPSGPRSNLSILTTKIVKFIPIFALYYNHNLTLQVFWKKNKKNRNKNLIVHRVVVQVPLLRTIQTQISRTSVISILYFIKRQNIMISVYFL